MEDKNKLFSLSISLYQLKETICQCIKRRKYKGSFVLFEIRNTNSERSNGFIANLTFQ